MSVWDIVVLVVIAALVASRFLVFKLPKDTRDKATRKAAYKNDLGKLFGRPAQPAEPRAEAKPLNGRRASTTSTAAGAPVSPAPRRISLKELEGMSGIDQIKALEPTFSETKFMEGARRAHAYFYECWNAKDLDGLASLCAPVLVNRIAAEWQDGWQKITVGEVEDIRISHARVSGRTAIVEAEITATHKEKRGAARKVKSRWLLARPIGSTDPNWELEDMKMEMDA